MHANREEDVVVPAPTGTTLYQAPLEADEEVLEVKTFEHTRLYPNPNRHGQFFTGDQVVKSWLDDSRGYWKILWTGVVTVKRDGAVVNDVMSVIVRTNK